MGWTIVIADDEAPAREELAYLIEQVNDVDTVIQAVGGMDAIKKVKEHAPDLLFLDMEMPDLNGLQIVQVIAELNPQVKIVFSTAYDQYAVEAFKLRAFHYILKPYDDNDVSNIFKELQRIDQGKTVKGQTETMRPAQTACVKLALEVEGGIKYVSPKDVVYISKEGKHVLVHTKDKAYDAAYTLQDLEGKLTPYGFFRCHKSYLIHMEAIVELKSWVNGAYNVIMSDSQQSMVPVSRNYVKDLRLMLEI
ncbi:LytR/AlgR family response regulator transcription factor [Paenibacillus sp. UNC451MF]|uniref:LytR/AlgR family response regulator transcription factor n=1 Tax=Paenibacillus sp. UNC451MF TaxID=1449063 RepID=UPI00048FABA9|nr:LytTR family DNA-binding domain-containing protein [Paenibacillus sp. UNC451MF]